MTQTPSLAGPNFFTAQKVELPAEPRFLFIRASLELAQLQVRELRRLAISPDPADSQQESKAIAAPIGSYCDPAIGSYCRPRTGAFPDVLGPSERELLAAPHRLRFPSLYLLGRRPVHCCGLLCGRAPGLPTWGGLSVGSRPPQTSSSRAGGKDDRWDWCAFWPPLPGATELSSPRTEARTGLWGWAPTRSLTIFCKLSKIWLNFLPVSILQLGK